MFWMREKYILRLPDNSGVVLGLRFDSREGEVFLGGPRRYNKLLEHVANQLRVTPVWLVDGWRMVGYARCTSAAWEVGKTRVFLEFVPERVTAFRRLLR